MKPFIRVQLDAGHLYEIPSEVIAANRAQYLLSARPDEFKNIDEALADVRIEFADEAEIFDWVQNNMNPEDYMPSSRLVRYTPEKDFANAEWTAHDQPAVIGELDGEQVLASPVEAVMAAMAASGQVCNITVLNNADGQPMSAAVMITGGPIAVTAFVNALQFTHDQLLAQATKGQPAPGAAH